ncbi:T-cell activation Rho GTPase-activating protein [Phodopus roborovskii]|uniref:T-cell activation Rho GTPase-activating protein n=1 Tax=Phodopus roborovskii TaxID=109678 RepID=A0AAV0A6Y4_PHORO|nr:T-cell activation Rho GTPase-activating protein [Phodopus roborovskii]CAH7309267.1 LOC101833978 [Phodopus roborovskii]
MKLISSLQSKTLNASNMETLIECQSEGDIKALPLLTSCDSEDSICQLIEVKKRKKVLSWPSLMRKLSPSSDFSGPLEPELKEPLFDQPLSVICGKNDVLPRPIQDILTILCLKGPSTEGIFRKAASEKARKELKEELNCGSPVDLNQLPVHLLAVVFKDFLRGIPLKLLSCDLFEEWMDALEKPSEEDRIEALKQVADRLPRPNLLLLRHSVYVLHLISKNAEVNKMDSSNLAICIGPNMLTLKNDQSLSFQAQKDLNSKVKTLVEFLIDNCFEIFGENIPTHSRITSDDSLEHTDSSDVSTLQNDSAYDSNDPDVEPTSAIPSPSRQPEGPTATVAGLDNQATCESSSEPFVSMVARLKSSIGQPDRRFSEPNMSPSPECLLGQRTKQKLTKSEDDVTMPQEASCLEGDGVEDPFTEEVFPAVEGKPKRPVDLKIKNLTQSLASSQGPVPKTLSRVSPGKSLDNSPIPSPSCPKRSFFTRHQSFTTKTDKIKPQREIRKHSMSFSFTSHKKLLPRTSSVGSEKSKDFSRDQIKKGLRKDSQLAGRIIQENESEIQSFSLSRTWALSVDNVFQLVEVRKPGNPPSYEEAIHCQASGLTAYSGQTVGSMRARMLKWNTALPPRLGGHHGEGTPGGHRLSPMTEHWKQSQTVSVSVETQGRSELHQLRTVSELDCLRRQHSHVVFEVDQLQCAKESYI